MQPNPHPLSAKPFRAVLLDLDGTLIATRRLLVESYAQALAPYLGYTPSEHDIMSRSPRAIRPFLSQIVESSELPACLDRFYQAYATLHATHFEGIYEGVLNMLNDLRQMGLTLAIVTGKSRRAWRIDAAHIDLGSIESWIFDDDVTAIKPNPEGLLLALKRLHLDPQQTIYLGDSLTDVEAAQAAGLLPGAVLWPKRVDEIDTFTQDALAYGATVFETPTSVVDFCSRRVNPSNP
ncbi:HAD family hydrolase [Candidatus Entotheonella palauensis]|uniref:phosphoglycolate phosphatase n=1 Tax=Candidatus Entotheonella gemina TaxID=1429439 RepID=W4LVT9_9BACT|nr:HAD-IA family hydrolase [Candidatus Entotheonella palauensis]ETX01861.1 MAG: hypothetical protein ETSY2_36560 [Candidatus Entotheonella gemina]